MKFAKPLVLSFSLLAFAGASAYANEAKKEKRDTQAQQSTQSQRAPQAQQPTQRRADMPSQRAQAAQQPGELLASNLKGMEVVNSQGQDIGDISDIVIDLNSGKVHAAVLEFGGFLGIGEKNFAFPISDLKPGKERNQVLMNIDKQALEKRDGFSKSQWPGMDDQYWGRVGGKQAGAGSGGQAQKMNLVRASELIGKDVQDKSGKNVGQVRDLVVGLQEGEVKNIVVGVQGGGRASVPAKAVKASGTDNRLVLDMSAEKLRAQSQPPQRPAGTGGMPGTGGTLNPADRPAQSK